jgi:hypothetical protein
VLGSSNVRYFNPPFNIWLNMTRCEKNESLGAIAAASMLEKSAAKYLKNMLLDNSYIF